jgi:hypothetical protein
MDLLSNVPGRSGSTISRARSPTESELDLWRNEPGPRRRYIEIVQAWEDAISDYLERAWGPAVPDADCRLVALAFASAVRASLETSTSSNDARAIAERGFDLLINGFIKVRPR